MAMDIDLNAVSDESVYRLWEGVMEQVAKDYINSYILYLKKQGVDSDVPYAEEHKLLSLKQRLIELEDYIVGDLIAGDHASYIIHGLREEARNCLNKKSRRRKQIIRRG